MLKMSKFESIINEIKTAESIVISVQVNMDGDAIGSAFSFATALKEMGKKVVVALPEAHPYYLSYFCDEYVTETDETFDLACALDSGDLKRIGKQQAVFERAKRKVVIDHHVSNP